ncbi:transposase [Rhizobium sp. BK376]|nr:transposase [Rhizobium sp. BK376]
MLWSRPLLTPRHHHCEGRPPNLQTRLAGLRPLHHLENSLEANHADNNRSNSSTDRYPLRSWCNFRLVGSVTWQRENVPPQHQWRRHRRFVCVLRQKAKRRKNTLYPLVVIQEVGLDGFWLGRVLSKEAWIESHIVEAASIAMPRRHRPAKTDCIDGEMLIRALIAWKRGEPRACSMVRLLTPEEDDNRRIGRERKTLIAERVFHVNRIKGLLFAQGIRDYEPVNRDRRQRLDELRTGDGRPLSKHLKADVCRELDRLELLLTQIKAVEAERDALIVRETLETPKEATALFGIKGIGPEFATILYTEGLFRHFDNRRQIAPYAGLAPPLGKALTSTANRASPRQEIRVYERPWSSSLGYGCGINRNRH